MVVTMNFSLLTRTGTWTSSIYWHFTIAYSFSVSMELLFESVSNDHENLDSLVNVSNCRGLGSRGVSLSAC